MKVCDLRFALLFLLYFYGVRGQSSYYEVEIQPYTQDVEASSVEEEKELHVNDPDIVSLSALVVDELNHERFGDDDPLSLMEIVKAATQEVSGNLILLTLKVSQGGVNEICEIKILDDPWSHKMTLLHSKCGTIPAKYEPYGGTYAYDEHRYDSHDGNNAVQELDVYNSEVVRLSRIAVDELNKQTAGGSDTNNLLETVKASILTVSGTTNLILTLKVSQGHVIKTCKVIMQQQIWLNETKVTEYNCENETNETFTEESKESHWSNDDYHIEASVNNDSPSETFPLAGEECETANDGDDVVDLNVNDVEVISLAAMSLIELNAEKQERDPPLTLTTILKAVLDTPSGKLTLTLKVSQGDTEDTCQINLWEDSAADELDITHSKCGTVPAKNEPKNINTRDEEVDVNDPEVVRLSVMALDELNSHNHAGDDPINLLEIVRVSTHIGTRNSTTITLKVSQGGAQEMCDVKIFEKSRSHGPQVIESRCEIIKHDEMHPIDHQAVHVSDETHYNYTEASDSVTLEGAELEDADSLEEEEELDVNDPEVIHLSASAMVTLNNEKLKEDDPLILLEIVKAAIHPSSGNFISVILKVSQGGNKYECEMEFFPQPDTVGSKIKHSKCGTVPAKLDTRDGDTPHLLGGVEKLEVNDPKVIRLSLIALVELYEKHPTEEPINLLEIVKASTQLVNGRLTFLTLKVSQGRQKKMCDVQILEQPWLKITKINQAECQDIHEKDDNLLEIYGVNGLTKIIPLSESVSSW